MKGPEKERRAQELEALLLEFHQDAIPLTGIVPVENMLSFVAQLIDSLHRVEYVYKIRKRPISVARTDPRSELFDPIKAAVFFSNNQKDEACWLVFLATHCGRNIRTKWLLARELYGAYERDPWTWVRVSVDPAAYGEWLEENRETFYGKFGNHRKYESLKPTPSGTAAAVSSYIDWIKRYGSHEQLIAHARAQTKGDERKAFRLLYDQMGKVIRFGRTGRFDYLMMLAKVGLASIDADSTYMNDATGPKKGARLLFDGQIDSKTGARLLEAQVAELEKHLGVGMQVMEDAICNWQKSPNRYMPFRG